MNFKKIWRHALLISPDVPLCVPPMLASVVLVNSAVPAGTKRGARVSPRRSPECAVTIVRIEANGRLPVLERQDGKAGEERGEKRGRNRGRGNSEEDDSPLGWSRSNFEFLRKKGGLCARVGVRAELPRVLFRVSPPRGVAASIDPSSGTALREGRREKKKLEPRKKTKGPTNYSRRAIESAAEDKLDGTENLSRNNELYAIDFSLRGRRGESSPLLSTSPSSGRVHFSLSSRGGPMS